MTWDPRTVQQRLRAAVAYLVDVHGDPWILDWWLDTGRHQSWAIPWDRFPRAKHAEIEDELADTLDYLDTALDNMDTVDVSVAIRRLDRQVRHWQQAT